MVDKGHLTEMPRVFSDAKAYSESPGPPRRAPGRRERRERGRIRNAGIRWRRGDENRQGFAHRSALETGPFRELATSERPAGYVNPPAG